MRACHAPRRRRSARRPRPHRRPPRRSDRHERAVATVAGPRRSFGPEALTGADADAVAGPALTTGRRPEVKVDLPKRKLILVTEDPSELRVALVEDGRLAEIYFERPEKRSYLGDIYRGKVENVLAGIDAAFVDFGLDKNGFLYVDEVRTGEGDRRGRRIGDVLKPGQDVLVQVMKDPMGSKGARLTMHISLAGRYVVYVPGGSGVGVSRRLSQDERDRLRDLCKELRVKNAGLIVRTAAEGEGLEEVRRDVRVLSRLWSRLKKKAETAPIPGLIHKEVDISLEVTRDLFNESVESLIVDDEKRHKAIVGFLDKVAPELVSRVRLHTGAEPLFEAYGIEQQISRALERRVPLPSGGNIVIDHAEALTVIDVNSGRYTSGKRPRGHDPADEPRGGTRSGAPASPARHRRHHHHRLHRHVAREEPRDGARHAGGGARHRPHQDLCRRAVPARPGRDDPPEHHRRRARDPHADLLNPVRARRARSRKRPWR